MKKVSIIVPAFNSHDTLARCLGSLVNQTLSDIEIIVINDASTDDTWEIMKRCEAQFPDKVMIIDGGINRGSGGARNQGFDMASGEYIGLVDSDDYVHPEMYERLYNRAKETGADIVDSGFYQEATDKATIFTGDNVAGDLDDEKRSILIAGGGYLVTRIFKRELFEEPRIRMREKIRCLEDTEIMIYTILKARSIANVKEIFYRYCDIKGSATKTMDLEIYFDSIYGAIEATYRLCHDLPTYEGAKEAVEYAMVNMYSYGINRCLYDQIARLGGDKKNVKKYFDNAGKKELELLRELSTLKQQVVTIPYEDNPEVVKRIDKLDIEIMKECDKRFG